MQTLRILVAAIDYLTAYFVSFVRDDVFGIFEMLELGNKPLLNEGLCGSLLKRRHVCDVMRGDR
jgi:hypothetical protein